jgi:hypothetical protein
MATPTRVAVANDLGEKCQLILGNFGYRFTNGKQPTIRAQRSSSPNAVFVGSADFLTMRDYDYFSRVVQNDWRNGQSQIRITVDDPVSKKRFYDSNNIDISTQGIIRLINGLAANANGTSSLSTPDTMPLHAAGGYLYMGLNNQMAFSSTWTSAPSSAPTTAPGDIVSMEDDGQYIYCSINGLGIQRGLIGSTATTTVFNNLSGNYKNMLFVNRRLYALEFSGSPATSNFWEFNTSGTRTNDFAPPVGWTLTDLAARTGGPIDSPIFLLGNDSGSQSMIWYWDGTTIHDYMSLPNGFVGNRLFFYQGIMFVYGYQYSSPVILSPCAYYIVNDTLGFLGYFGTPPSYGGDPTPIGTTPRHGYWMDAFQTSVYFSVALGGFQEVWRYDIANGGLSRWASKFTGSNDVHPLHSLKLFKGKPWVTQEAVGLYSVGTTYNPSGVLTTSDLHLGQPWAPNLWVRIEITSSALQAGESIVIDYSVDSGNTFTNAGTLSNAGDGAISFKAFTVSTATTSQVTNYIRVRATFNAGTGNNTTPSIYSIALKAAPADPTGPLIDCWLACPDQMVGANGEPDFQGASGAERIQNIITLYETQAIVNCIYMASGTTRAKNPVTIPVKVIDYEVQEPSSVGFGPNRGVEGDVHVILRQAS